MPNTLIGEGRQAGIYLALKNGVATVRERWYYKVKGASRTESRDSIVSTSGLPTVGVDVNPAGTALCTGKDAERNPENPFYWDVTCEYSSEVNDNTGATGGGADPYTWVPIRETFLQPHKVFKCKAKNSKPFTNGAGMALSSYPEQSIDILRWDFVQFENPATVTDSVIALRNDAINNASFLSMAKHTLLLTVRKSVVGYYYGAARRFTEYSLTYNPENWHEKVANVGTTFKNASGQICDYIFYDTKNPEGTIVLGPLGSRDVLYDQDFNAADGQPTGGIDTTDANKAKRNPATISQIYFIERMVKDELNFSSFLRVT